MMMFSLSTAAGAAGERSFGPLLATGRRLGVLYASWFGSAAGRSAGEAGDVDLHLVVPRLNRAAYEALLAAAKATAAALAAGAGRPWQVELRHGPFKPPPGARRKLQLHFLLDDEASLALLPCALLAHRAATGALLAGGPLLGRRADCLAGATWLAEACSELARWRGAVAASEIPYRHWVFAPGPRLVEERAAARTGWELNCLLHGAAMSADLHGRAAVAMAPQAVDDLAAGELSRPLLAGLPRKPAWQTLSRSWSGAGGVQEQVLALLDRRLEHLARR